MTPGIGLYRPRRTPLHLAPAWLKLLALAAAGVFVYRLDGVRPTAVAAACALAALISTLPPARATVKGVLLFAVLAALGGAYHWIFGDPATGAEITLTIIAIVLAALTINTSTSADELFGLFSAMARPLQRWVPTEALSLAMSLMVRSVPETARILLESRAAARARGLGRSPRATLMPTGVRVVGYALAVGDAITARGLADFDAKPPR